MLKLKPSSLSLISPSDRILNEIASEVSPGEIKSQFIQGVIDRILELSAGKGASKHDTRQMVGLAAVQLGVGKRIITIDMTADGSNKPQDLRVLINPKITEYSKVIVPGREGCWSCGDICGNVDRSKSVTLEALDRTGEPVSYKLTDFVARIAQHETDHLDGIRFPDRIPADKPERLHLVLPSEFPEYRLKWATWETLCPRERWEKLKAGSE
jgi:peptide deformylase